MGRNRILRELQDNSDIGLPEDQQFAFSSSSIPDATADVFREIKAGVSKVESRLGIDIPNDTLGFADMDSLGLHVTDTSGPNANRIDVLLQRDFYNRKSSEIIADMDRMAKQNWLGNPNGKNNKLQYIIVHELAHSIWVNRIEGQDRKIDTVSKRVRELYSQHNKRRENVIRRTGSDTYAPISRYAKTNINEFVAEGIAKGLLSKNPDRYSSELVKLFRNNRDLLQSN